MLNMLGPNLPALTRFHTDLKKSAVSLQKCYYPLNYSHCKYYKLQYIDFL